MSTVQPPQNWLDSMTTMQRFILQMGMAGVVIIALFVVWYAFRQVTQEEIVMLKEQIKEVKEDNRNTNQAHGKALDTIVKMSTEQREHDKTERAETRKVMEVLANEIKAKRDVLEAVPAPKK